MLKYISYKEIKKSKYREGGRGWKWVNGGGRVNEGEGDGNG